MSKTSWVTEQEASKELGVKETTLQHWRSIGYLKPGTHWRNAVDKESPCLKPKVLYHLRWSKEVIEYWREHDAPMKDLAA